MKVLIALSLGLLTSTAFAQEMLISGTISTQLKT